MLCRVLSNPIQEWLQAIMFEKDCRKSANNHNVMEAVLWRLTNPQGDRILIRTYEDTPQAFFSLRLIHIGDKPAVPGGCLK